jgi:FkbM family methyltransferase
MLAPVVEFVRSTLIRFGRVDVTRFVPRYHPLARRARLLQTHRIDLVLDVGANAGQYGGELRTLLGYRGRIVSFEPLSSAFALLQKRAAADRLWRVERCALGATSGEMEINIAGNSTSSSFLPMLDVHEKTAPESRYVGKERVMCRTLDEIWDEHVSSDDRVFVKLDVQGFEAQVLDGAARSLPKAVGIQVELSLTPLYDGAPTYLDVCRRLEGLGFHIEALETGLVEPASGRLLQVDGIFFSNKNAC